MKTDNNQPANEPLFRIRSYSLGELALLYNPHLLPDSATRLLRRWINHHPTLTTRLLAEGYKPGQRILTPRQVSYIIEALGEP